MLVVQDSYMALHSVTGLRIAARCEAERSTVDKLTTGRAQGGGWYLMHSYIGNSTRLPVMCVVKRSTPVN